jgi:hypothetical protein
MLAALVLTACWAVPRVRAELNEFRDRAPRALLLGDSIMDQQGKPAAILLRQAGIETEVHGAWGTGLLTREQYDHGRTILSPASNENFNWLVEGPKLVERMRPDVVVVYLDHNYWPPFPRDLGGSEIHDLRSPAGQEMIATQARVFIDLLRERGADVVFVEPVPGEQSNAVADNPIWAAYLPVLQDMDVDVIDIRSTLAGTDGRRVETKPDCAGDAAAIRPNNDLHLTRLGSGRAATALALGIAARFGRDLAGNPAPGEHTVALVPTRTGNGYWIVGCDGGVYRFGDAPSVPGEHPQPGDPVVGAVRAGGRGLWLVTRAGTILRRGDAPKLSFGPRPVGALVDAAGTTTGIVAVSASGNVVTAGTAIERGDVVAAAPAVAIASHPAGAGYWIVTADGRVHGFGVPTYGDAENHALNPVTGITASATGSGYWMARADGAIAALGDANGLARVVKEDPSAGGAAAVTPDAPTAAIASTGTRVWIVDDNGAVHARGTASDLGGTGNLALFTN